LQNCPRAGCNIDSLAANHSAPQLIAPQTTPQLHGNKVA